MLRSNFIGLYFYTKHVVKQSILNYTKLVKVTRQSSMLQLFEALKLIYIIFLKEIRLQSAEQEHIHYLCELVIASLMMLNGGPRDRQTDIYTVKPVLSGHSKKDKTMILMTNGSLMKVESIAECSPWSILQYF